MKVGTKTRLLGVIIISVGLGLNLGIGKMERSTRTISPRYYCSGFPSQQQRSGLLQRFAKQQRLLRSNGLHVRYAIRQRSCSLNPVQRISGGSSMMKSTIRSTSPLRVKDPQSSASSEVVDSKAVITEKLLETVFDVSRCIIKINRGKDTLWDQVDLLCTQGQSEGPLKVVYSNSRQNISRLYKGEERWSKIRSIITDAGNISHILVQRQQDGDLDYLFGDPLLDFRHHRFSTYDECFEVSREILPEMHIPFLVYMGMMHPDGKVKRPHFSKFVQVQQILNFMLTISPKGIQFAGTNNIFTPGTDEEVINIADFGCGSAHLTFALHWVLQEMMGLNVRTFGVDLQRHLINKHNNLARNLSWNLEFDDAAIVDWMSDDNYKTKLDIVVALHACDVATDQALLQALVRESKIILVAPCCHHHLNQQLHQQVRSLNMMKSKKSGGGTSTKEKGLEALGYRQTENLALIKHDSILKQQIADMLTDWFRAHILRAFGYKVEIVEFVQSKHTGKNLLIRAHKRPDGFVDPAIIEEYAKMKEKWAVTPHLETLLRKNNCWWE